MATRTNRASATGHAAAPRSPAAAGRVRDIMTPDVVTVQQDTPVGDIADTLARHRISGVPVLAASGAVVGLVSEYDLLAKDGATAADVMTAAVISVTPDTEVAAVRHLLVDRQIRRVPVLDAGRLVGVVARGDVVALLATEWVCQVCGEPVRGERPPATCPKCHGGGERFVLQEPPPGV